MDSELKRKLLAEIDTYVIQKQMGNAKIKIAEVIKPELERLSKEHHVDMVDLFVAYMDHVAINSKNMSSNDLGMQVDIDQADIKLY
jgi:chromosome condensin MukBEF complex kleisin-like MukF subunit